MISRNMKLLIGKFVDSAFDCVWIICLCIIFVTAVLTMIDDIAEGTLLLLYFLLFTSLFALYKKMYKICIVKIEILDDNIIFTTEKNKLLSFKMYDIDKCYSVYHKGGLTGYFFKLKPNKRLFVYKYVEFYIEGYDNTHLFREFFKLE